MITGKGNCHLIHVPCIDHCLRGCFPAWGAHPSWKLAMDSLDAYYHWVSDIVLPIAFQWIEEHKDDVYCTIPKEQREDIGVVISAAFERVRQMPYYQEGVKMGEDFERDKENGTLDPSKYNPVWTAIAARILKEKHTAFEDYKDVLKHSGEE